MIFNYALSHYSIEEVNFDDETYYNLKTFLQTIDKENIILIVDKGGALISKLKKNIAEFNRFKKTDYLFLLLERINDNRKIYRHEFKYNEDNVEEFMESIKNTGIELDAVITDQEEQYRFSNSIPLQEFSEEHPNDKKRSEINKKGINLIKLNHLELNNFYLRTVWDSSDFIYIDYNLGKFGLKEFEKDNIKFV